MSLDSNFLMPTAVGLALLILVVLLWLRFRPVQLECRDPLFTPEFRAFLGQLDIAIRSHLGIFPAVPVADVLTGNSGGKALLNRMSDKRFDFVICSRRDMRVLCVIKLGGSEAEKEKIRKLCLMADLTLLEYDIKPYRDVPSLRQEVFGACGIDEFELPHNGLNNDSANKNENSACPKCGPDMRLRVIRKGTRLKSKAKD